MKRFTRLSESEIVTPEFVADKIINGLPAKAIDKNTMLLDIASKQGEFVYAVYKKFGPAIANKFYSIPTSKIICLKQFALGLSISIRLEYLLNHDVLQP